jgi:hypothetical protein
MAGSPYHRHRHPVPTHGTVTASLHIMVRGALAPQGTPIHVTLGIIDQFGEEYRLKKITIPAGDSTPPKSPWPVLIRDLLKKFAGFRPLPALESVDTSRPLPDSHHSIAVYPVVLKLLI